eukprot:5177024-Amphidinium_carterae.2
MATVMLGVWAAFEELGLSQPQAATLISIHLSLLVRTSKAAYPLAKVVSRRACRLRLPTNPSAYCALGSNMQTEGNITITRAKGTPLEKKSFGIRCWIALVGGEG